MKNKIRKNLIKFLSKTSLIRSFLKFYYNHTSKANEKEFNKIKKTGFVPIPKTAKFEPTLRCNLNCAMCHQREKRKAIKEELTFTQIKKIINNLKQNGVKNILLVGGEIFLRKDIFDILDYLQKLNMNVRIITNGTLFADKNIEKILSYNNIMRIAFSIDGPEKQHDEIRRVKGSFKKAITTIKKLSKKGILIGITCVLQKKNIFHIPYMIKLAKNIGADDIIFTTEMFSTASEINSSKRLPEFKDIKVYTNLQDSNKYSYSLQEAKKVINLIKQESKKNKILATVMPQPTYTHTTDFYNGGINKYRLVCMELSKIAIDSKGQIMLCPLMHEYYGNLLDKSLKDIWNSNKARTFRKNLLKYNLLPLCNRCCSINTLN